MESVQNVISNSVAPVDIRKPYQAYGTAQLVAVEVLVSKIIRSILKMENRGIAELAFVHLLSIPFMGGIGAPKSFWTKVTTDTSILDHLLQLYFAWIHPIHTLFSEARFSDSYGRQNETYCSSVLVDSVCALACSLHTAVDGEEAEWQSITETQF